MSRLVCNEPAPGLRRGVVDRCSPGLRRGVVDKCSPGLRRGVVVDKCSPGLRRGVAGVVLVLGCLWLLPGLGGAARVQAQQAQQAQEAAPTDAADDRAASFRTVTGGVKEDVAGGPLMLGAYAVVWVALFGYVWRLNRLQRSVQVNLDRLERSVSGEAAR